MPYFPLTPYLVSNRDSSSKFTFAPVWNCVIFIKSGYYKNGIIHFNIEIPEGYPHAVPRVKFLTKVLHPQIGDDGILDISKKFPKWDPRSCFIWKILCFVKRILHIPQTLAEPANQAACTL
jgi:ubiquitin-protein ligase